MALQRRLLIGEQELVLFNPRVEDNLWVLPGHTKNRPRLVRTHELKAYADANGLSFEMTFVDIQQKAEEKV